MNEIKSKQMRERYIEEILEPLVVRRPTSELSFERLANQFFEVGLASMSHAFAVTHRVGEQPDERGKRTAMSCCFAAAVAGALADLVASDEHKEAAEILGDLRRLLIDGNYDRIFEIGTEVMFRYWMVDSCVREKRQEGEAAEIASGSKGTRP